MINYKGKFLKADKLEQLSINRGLSFGDGIFETLICSASEIYHFPYHWKRLCEACEVLDYDLKINQDELKIQILRSIQESRDPSKYYRIKFILWRAGEGKYSPETQAVDWIISVQKFIGSTLQLIEKCGISENVKLQYSLSSSFKTISALPYVLAAQEKNKKAYDELILLNANGEISEASAANLFIYDHQQRRFYTPPVSSGCINGVIRRKLISSLKAENFIVEERSFKPNELHEELVLFTTNVAGIHQILSINNTKFFREHNLNAIFKEVMPYQEFS